MMEKPQFYMVCITIIEGRHFAMANMDSVVHVRVGDQKKTTNVQRSTDCPYYNEYFVFEFNSTLQDLLDMQLTLTIIQPRKVWRTRKYLGYFSLDLSIVWAESQHQFYHKWAVISAPPRKNKSGPMGYIKIDLGILSKGEVPHFPRSADTADDIDKNLLLPENISYDRPRANFIFNIYRAEGIPKIKKSLLKKTILMDNEQQPSTYIKISLGGLTAKTSIKKNTQNPVWNERILITQLFPPLCDRIWFELRFAQNDIVMKNYIYLKSISNKGENGFLPTFGPSYIYFYTSPSSDGEYCGKLLLEINTEILNDLIWSSKCIDVLPIKTLPNFYLWNVEPIMLFCTIYSVTMIEKKFKGKSLSFELNMGTINCENISTINENVTPCFKPLIDNENHYCYLPFNGEVPCLKFVSHWPDIRRNMYNINMIEKIHNLLKSDLDYIETLFESDNYGSRKEEINALLLKSLEKLEANCRIYLKFSNSIEKSKIKLEQKKLEICLREIKDIEQTVGKLIYFKSRKKLFRKLRKLLLRLHDLIDNGQECWPDIFLSMAINTKRVSAFRIPARKVIFSNIAEERGILCGVINDEYLKPITTKGNSSISCKIVVQMCLGLVSDGQECVEKIPECFETNDTEKSIIPSSVVCEEKYRFMCKAHVYEGRFMPGADKTGLADPYVMVVLNEKVGKTKAIHKTLNPVWDQTLILQEIILYGSLEYLKYNIPQIVMEVYDVDYCKINEFIGRCSLTPEIVFDQTESDKTRLKWCKLDNGEFDIQGEILVAAELILVTDSSVIFEEPVQVPIDIKPKKEKIRLDVYFWGVHDLKKNCLTTIKKPKVVVEIGGTTIHSTVIQNTKKCLNFENPYQFVDIELPYEKEYYPSLIIKMFNCCDFGWYNYVGVCKSNIRNYVYTPLTLSQRNHLILEGQKASSETTTTSSEPSASQQSKSEIQSSIMSTETNVSKKRKFSSIFLLGQFLMKKNENTTEQNTKVEENDDVYPDLLDWWTRFHISLQCASNEDLLNSTETKKAFIIQIYNSELESQPEFNNFNDMFRTFEIYRGKRTGDDVLDADNIIATFKGAIRIYRWPPNEHEAEECVIENGLPLKDGSFQHFPTNEPIRFVVRAYIIRAINLTPKDLSGKSDPYIKITMGDKLINDKDRYIANQVNPVFGRCYELKGTFPFDKMIKISVWDRDITTSDDLIGETKIDIEKRLYTKHRASCGIPNKYFDHGPCAWRDQHKPSQILENLCKKNGIGDPEYFENYIKVGPCVFSTNSTDSTDYKNKKDMLSVLALHHWKEVPIVGCPLVPEHVETRSLFHPFKPGLEQGKLQLWIDLFPVEDIPPPFPVDITPQVPQLYELRIIVWNTEDVILDEDDFFVGEKKSDIYVKGWMINPAQSQYTDVHYNSISGEGNFNWRLIFPFYYLSTENKIVMQEKRSVFSLDSTEYKLPCRLTLQVWDNDIFSPDDFLGSLTINLSRMPRGAKSSKLCSLSILDPKAPTMNLFKIRRHKGWWPFKGRCTESNKKILTGKIEAEFQLLTEDESLKYPAGLGRSDPQRLPEPNRPDISFSWLRNPLKAMKFLVCKRFRCQMIIFTLIVLLIIMVLIAVYAFPTYAIKKLLGA